MKSSQRSQDVLQFLRGILKEFASQFLIFAVCLLGIFGSIWLSSGPFTWADTIVPMASTLLIALVSILMIRQVLRGWKRGKGERSLPSNILYGICSLIVISTFSGVSLLFAVMLWKSLQA